MNFLWANSDPLYISHSNLVECAVEVVMKNLHGEKTWRMNIRKSRLFTFGWVCADSNLLCFRPTYHFNKSSDNCIAELTAGGQHHP